MHEQTIPGRLFRPRDGLGTRLRPVARGGSRGFGRTPFLARQSAKRELIIIIMSTQLSRGFGTSDDMVSGVTGDMASQGIWHPRVKFPRDFGIPKGNLASPRF